MSTRASKKQKTTASPISSPQMSSLRFPTSSLHDPLEPELKDLLERHSLLVDDFTLTLADPLPSSLITYSRLAFMTTEEAYFHDPRGPLDGPVTPRNELQMHVALKRALKKLKNGENDSIVNASLAVLSDRCQEFVLQGQETLPAEVSSPDTGSAMQQLLKFVDSQGARHDRVVVSDFPATTGRGMAAAVDIAEGDVIVEIPEALLFSAKKAYESERVGKIFAEIEGLEDDSVLLLFLIYERFVNPESKWKAYFDSLPAAFSTALSFNVGDLLELDGSTLMEETIQVKEHIRLTHEMFFPELSNYYPEVFKAEAFTYENFIWARGLFDSRAINMKIGGDVKTCLVPFVDMINHSLHAGVPAGTFDDEARCFKLTTNSPYKKGSQVFLHYGPLKNWQLLLYYGFLIPQNPYDSMSVYFELPEGELEERKRALLEKLNLTQEHFVRAASISPRALAALRVCVSNAGDLAVMEAGTSDPRQGKISQENEEEALNAFLSTVQALLSERISQPEGSEDEAGDEDEDEDEDKDEEEEGGDAEEDAQSANGALAKTFKQSEVELLQHAVQLAQRSLEKL